MRLNDKERVAIAATIAAMPPKQQRRMRQWLRFQDALEVMAARCRARSRKGTPS